MTEVKTAIMTEVKIERIEAEEIVQTMLHNSGFIKPPLKCKVRSYDNSRNAWVVRVWPRNSKLTAGVVVVDCESGKILEVGDNLPRYAQNRGKEIILPQ